MEHGLFDVNKAKALLSLEGLWH